MTTIQIKRGVTANRSAHVGQSGEPMWDTEQKKLYVGDGSTSGGVGVNSNLEQLMALDARAQQMRAVCPSGWLPPHPLPSDGCIRPHLR